MRIDTVSKSSPSHLWYVEMFILILQCSGYVFAVQCSMILYMGSALCAMFGMVYYSNVVNCACGAIASFLHVWVWLQPVGS